MSPPTRLRLDDLTLDTGQRRVQRGSEEIELPKLSFDLLTALAEAAPNSLSTDDLMDRVWQGAVVSPATVAKRVELLRQALGDDSNKPRYVALVRGHGYRLIPDVGTADDADSPRRRLPLKVPAIVIAVVAVLAFGWFATRPDALAPEKSIAVLPFLSLSGDAGDEIFADGLTEELSHALARLGELKVAGRTSSFHYKGRNEDLRTIGEDLGVANLLEGSVRRSGDTIRITAQLISADDGFHLWSETYDREMADVLDIQADIAKNVAAKLLVSLNLGTEAERRRTSDNPEAYASYLKAVTLSPYGDFSRLAEAQDLIENAVRLDPGFASAWNRLAAIHGRRLFARDPTYPHSPQESMRILHDAVERALAIDPESGEAYANLGGAAWVFERDAAKAAPLIEKAVALDPWNLDLIAFAAEFAKFIGRQDESLVLEELLLDRDPLCTNCRHRLAISYLYTGRLADAEREFRTLRSTFGEGYLWSLGVVHLLRARPDEALLSFEQMAGANYLGPYMLQGRTMALFDLGRHAEFETAIGELIQGWGETNPREVAEALAYTGRVDEAFGMLDAAIPKDTVDLQTHFPTPLLGNLHSDDRWLEFLRKIDRAPEQVAAIPFELNTVLNP